MAAQAITQGAIEAIFFDPDRAQRQFPVPVLQCLQIKTLSGQQTGAQQPGGAERYRIVLSDMRNYVQCMLATQANHVVHDGSLQRNCIVRLKQYQAQSVKGKWVLVVLDLEVITSLGTPDKIGEPKGLDTRDTEPQANAMGGTSFYGAKQEPQESKSQVQRQISTGSTRSNGSGGGGMSHNGSVIYPVEALSPYNSKWTIKVRVRSKPPIRTWHKASGEGKLFNVILFDETGDIRMTGFNDAVDRWYDVLQEGQVYYISGCKVRMAQRKLDARASDYEMVIDRDTVIEKAEDDGSVPQVRLNLCNIQDLQNVEANTIVDVLGVIKEVGPVDSIISKTTQKPFDKRDITLVDDTGYSVRLTLWGKQATSFDATEESIVAFKDCKVSDFNGRNLSLLSSGSWSADPDIPEAHRLKGWYDSMGRTQSFLTHKSMSSVGAATGRKDDFKTVRQVKDENLGMGEQPDYFSLKGTIVAIKQDNFCYPSCLTDNPPCNKKVTDMGDGTWRCEKCDVTHDRARYRYNLGVMVSDHTGHLWVTCFDDIANVVMGRTADELVSLQGDKAALDAIFEEASCQKLTFRVRAKMDTFGDMPRVRYQAMSATPIDFKSEGHKLAELIRQMSV